MFELECKRGGCMKIKQIWSWGRTRALLLLKKILRNFVKLWKRMLVLRLSFLCYRESNPIHINPFVLQGLAGSTYPVLYNLHSLWNEMDLLNDQLLMLSSTKRLVLRTSISFGHFRWNDTTGHLQCHEMAELEQGICSGSYFHFGREGTTINFIRQLVRQH